MLIRALSAFVSVFVLLCAFGAPVLARDALADAVIAAGKRDWAAVEMARQKIENAAARDVVEWLKLRGARGSFRDCLNFLGSHGDWPGLKYLRRVCESRIPVFADPGAVIGFFDRQLPQTAAGSLRLVEAYGTAGRKDDARAEARRAWVTFNMSKADYATFLQRYAKDFEDLHVERFDMLLWRGKGRAVHRMFPLLDEGHIKLARARLGLRGNEDGVDALIEAVPKSLAADPGLAYERFMWRLRKGRTGSAAEILLKTSVSLEALGRPVEWANSRRSLARELMRAGEASQAYLIASSHYLLAGSHYADLEWLSGFIALRMLDAPEEAVAHFERFQAAVETPISRGRAGYWLGRAYEALEQPEKAQAAYREGARFQSSFYGQLAAERAGVTRDIRMTGKEVFPDWREAEFTKSSVFEAAVQLQEASQLALAERFLVHLAETQTREGIGQLADFALHLKEPHIALMLSKQAARMGHEIYRSYFPLTAPAGLEMQIPPEFAMAIARRESEFDPSVQSPAGARGLMQLMPATARAVSQRLGEPYSLERLVGDPLYNARLGTRYLEEMAVRYGGNPILMSVAYNAGPSRATLWQKERGDPRLKEVDVVDWIEHIPFRETRNYVMRVTESFAPYRARLSGVLDGEKLSEILKR